MCRSHRAARTAPARTAPARTAPARLFGGAHGARHATAGIPCRGSQVVLTIVCSQLYAHNCMLTTVCSQLYGVPQNCMVKLYVCRSYVKLYALIVINYLRKRLASNSLIKLSVKLK